MKGKKEIRKDKPNVDEKKSNGPDEIQKIIIEKLVVNGICGIY
jgi:hypothetical protein